MAIERTFSIIKPDATRRNLTGKINAKFEDAGLRIVAQKRIKLWGKAAILSFSMALVIAAGRANRDSRQSPVGIGAFNLVRAEPFA